MKGILFLIFAELMTVPITALFCQWRLRRKKGISYGTMMAGALCASALFVASSTIYFNGWEVLHLDAWLDDKFFGRVAVFFILGSVSLLCVLPALGVVVYYQRRFKRDETRQL
jgi:hypothetical protein